MNPTRYILFKYIYNRIYHSLMHRTEMYQSKTHEVNKIAKKMIYKQFVFTMVNSASDPSTRYKDWPEVMQDLATIMPKGFKIVELQAYASSSSDALTTALGINLFKNVSESAHHVDPTATPGEAISQAYGCFFAKTWTRGEFGAGTDQQQSLLILHKFAEPVDFDPNDRLNIETNYNNKSAAVTTAYIRLLLHIEVK